MLKKNLPVYNKDGFASGTFSFYEMDVFAQMLVESKSDKKYNFTHWAFCKWTKQLCIPDVYCGYNWCIKVGKRRYITRVYAKDRNGVKVAWGIFCFVGTEKNYCNLKNKTYN